MLIHAGNKPLKVAEAVDRDGMVWWTFNLKAPAWTAETEMMEGDIVSPLNPTGYYYVVSSSGVTGATEPTWATTKNATTTDGTVQFTAANNNTYLSTQSYIVDASFTASDGVEIAASSFSAAKAVVKIGAIPADVRQFTLTLTFEVESGQPTTETDERSIIVKVVER